jgi:hypothetical protein
LNSVLGRLTCSGFGSMFKATDFAVNANQPSTASTASAELTAMAAGLGRFRPARDAVASLAGLNAIG